MVPEKSVDDQPNRGENLRVGILTGPTATGKTDLALRLCEEHGSVEIINADSLVVYREMNIGTAKPSAEDLARVPHHLVDIRNPDQPYNAGDFVREVGAAIDRIHSRGKRALITGGTGFYLKALIYGLWEDSRSAPEVRKELEKIDSPTLYRELEARDPESAHRIGVNDRYRLLRSHELLRVTGKTPSQLEAESATKPADPRFELWIVDRDPAELESRIAERTQAMLKLGLIEETQALRARYPGAPALSSVGYAQVQAYLDGVVPTGRKLKPGIDGLADEIILATRQLVKRQRTWFRGQHDGQWFTLSDDTESESPIQAAFKAIYPSHNGR